MSITDNLYSSPNGIYTISLDPGDGSFCIWRGDSYVIAFDTFEKAKTYLKAFLRVNKDQ